MALPPAEPLFAHLSALKEAADPTDPRHAARWRAVSDWLDAAFPGEREGLADARQEALFSLVRHVGGMRAEAPLQCAKWVATIVRRKRVDALRARKNDPLLEGMRNEPRTPGPPLIDRLEASDARVLPRGALEQLVETCMGHVHRALEEDVRSASRRLLRRTQAQATLLRVVCGWDSEEITDALEVGEPIGKDRLYKWIERGREPALRGLERWAAEDAEAHDVIAVIRELIEERRADAGKPRPERRRDRPEEPS